ncbi:hypothetical protein ACP8HI_05715 [Paenibacillus sp. FA6]|uniref:hypothetical protein n=1 Tax=Paenibacillus sp. FA6 TaxID=3413029 RepID=UPI003F656577
MKSVELQIAVPRTQEAGKIQNEMQQRSGQDQSFLTNQQIKESRAMQQRSNGVDQTENSILRDGGKEQQTSQENAHSQSNQTELQSEQHPAEHPYKGHHIDLSL